MDVSVIIVNWNTGGLLRRCLDALPRSLPRHASEVLVVDNHSTDESIARAEGSPQLFRLFSMTSNIGFSRATNVGIRQAKGEVIILLNPDTEPEEGSLSTLVDFLRAHPQAAAVGPRLVNADGSLQRSCRRFPTAATLALLFLKVPHVFPSTPALRHYLMEDFPHDAERRVEQIMGACMAIPRTAFERVGLFDERYWIWFEEVDWCRRAADAHREIWFTPGGRVLHYGGVSFRHVLPVHKEWRFVRSALRYAGRHLGSGAVLLLLALAPLALLLDTTAFLPWFSRSRQSSTD